MSEVRPAGTFHTVRLWFQIVLYTAGQSLDYASV